MQNFNPTYNIDSAKLKKFRAMSQNGLKELTWDERQSYGLEVEKAVLAAQKSQLKGYAEVMPTANCASGTWHTTAEEIENAIRARQHAQLMAYPAKVRKARTDQKWKDMYDEAMAIKRKLLT